MAELLASYTTPVQDDFGSYFARAVGRLAADHMWEGWLEFVPVDGGTDVLVSGIESRQPERQHLAYWATGLTHVYLEGALSRARESLTVRVVVQRPQRPDAVLDPFDVGARSLDILRQELTALNRPRLLTIIARYDLSSGADLSFLSDAQLVEVIVAAVAARLSHAR